MAPLLKQSALEVPCPPPNFEMLPMSMHFSSDGLHHTGKELRVLKAGLSEGRAWGASGPYKKFAALVSEEGCERQV